MTMQEPTRESRFTIGDDIPGEESAARDDRQPAPSAGDRGRERTSDEDESLDSGEEAEFEEILPPASVREGFARLAEAVRDIVRIRPLSVLAAAAGAAYVAGRIASRR